MNNSLRGILFWWWLKIIPTTTITIPWPKLVWLTLHDDGDGSKTQSLTCDPNNIYRPWLEKNVGKQYIDWDWNISRTDIDGLDIKFRKGKYKWATLFLLTH
jgi:hypothetical protein